MASHNAELPKSEIFDDQAGRKINREIWQNRNIGATSRYDPDGDWDRTPGALEVHPQRVWDWSDLQIARAAASDFKGFELATLLATVASDPRPVPLAPLTENDLAAEIEPSDRVARMRPGSTHEFVVRVTNRGYKSWPSFSGEGLMYARHLVVLVARWLAEGEPLAGVGDVARFPSNVAPGAGAEVALRLTAPLRRGAYEIEVQVSQALDGEHGVVGPNALTLPMRVE